MRGVFMRTLGFTLGFGEVLKMKINSSHSLVPPFYRTCGGCTPGTTWVLADHGYFTGPEVVAFREQHGRWPITAVHDRPWTVQITFCPNKSEPSTAKQI